MPAAVQLSGPPCRRHSRSRSPTAGCRRRTCCRRQACCRQKLVRPMALPQPCRQAFPGRWAAGEAGAAFSDASSAAPESAAPGTAVLLLERDFPPSARSLSEASRLSSFVGTSRPARLRGCGYRSRAARLSVPEPLRDLGRATSERHRRRFEGFAKMGQDLPNRPWLRDKRDQPNVATTTGALDGKSSPTRAMS